MEAETKAVEEKLQEELERSLSQEPDRAADAGGPESAFRHIFRKRKSLLTRRR